jgi:hypothetical protein
MEKYSPDAYFDKPSRRLGVENTITLALKNEYFIAFLRQLGKSLLKKR